MHWWPERLPWGLMPVLSCLVVLGIVGVGDSRREASSGPAKQNPPAQDGSAAHLKFVRAFSGAEDVRRQMHPVVDRSLDIVAGPADPRLREDKLQSPQSVATDAAHRVFVTDADAGVVHIFDFEQSTYSVLNDRGAGMRSPADVAIDRAGRVYVTDRALDAVLVFEGKGKFLRYLGKGEGSETYFQAPLGIAVDAGGHVYVCDTQRHMILVLDRKGRITGHIGKRGGGKEPGEFRYPSRIVIAGDELFVLDSGNTRVEVLDLGGHFRRELRLAEADQQDGLAVDDNKNLYVSDGQISVINVFDREGRFLYKFGRAGIKAGEFSRPSGMWAESGNRLFVADAGNRRVQEFEVGQQK